MRLTDEEEAMRAGRHGPALQWAIDHQIRVGRYLGAADFVPLCGPRSNSAAGPSALSAGLTGRTPRYGYHLDERRRASLIVDVAWTPHELNDWGALGGVVGRLARG